MGFLHCPGGTDSDDSDGYPVAPETDAAVDKNEADALIGKAGGLWLKAKALRAEAAKARAEGDAMWGKAKILRAKARARGLLRPLEGDSDD